MRFKKIFQKFTFAFLSVALFANFAYSQKPGNTVPRQERLLNGLKVLMWNIPSSDKVTVKIRVHSGSAFDPQDKEGVMKLLSENIFPNEAAKAFFAEDLGGSLEVVSNYDYIQINASGRTDQFLSMLETLAAAIANPTIDKEITAVLKTALTAKLRELEKDPAYIADRAVAKRLFGTFPYGRPQLGTPDSIQKIDFADLKFANDRLFSADNATITISGSLNGDQTIRAVRRYFGAWLKSDKKIPSTFRQPDEPDTAPLEIATPNVTGSQARYAFRGLARNDKDYAASEILSKILDTRFKSVVNSGHVVHNAHILPGAVVFRNASSEGSAKKLPAGISTAVTSEEFQRAKSEILAANANRRVDDLWLDSDTYKFVLTDENQAFQNSSLADVQRVADRLAKNPVVSVTVQSTPPVPVNSL